ncbi:hypothetical protein, partial [Aeromonas veronii]|uniref:hypothetical protein n=1 Tax=Aeromonas veronii TaxID=654 RepID=UPI003B9F17DF
VVLRPVGDGVKRLAHDADLKGMVMIRSPRPQLVPFKPHRFGKQRRLKVETSPDKPLFNGAELIVLRGRLTPWRHSTKMARLHRSAAIQADKMDKGM